MLPIRIVADNMSLLRSSGLWRNFRRHKHSAPLELSRSVTARLHLDCVSLWPKLNFSAIC